MGCREICLDLKQKDEVKLLSADPDYKRVAPPKLRNYDEKKRVVYPLERFQHPNHMKLNGCFLCHVRDQKEIPCRICGRNCDINCVRTDPSMPDCFEIDPTHNTHRKSVCLECRYFKSMKGITYATERRVEAKDDKKREKSKSIATPTSRPRARMRKRGEQNFPDPSTLPTGEIQLNVQWEGATRTIGAITVDADANLQVINDVFMSEFKQNQLFHYLCRGKGVHPEWWDIFTAKYLHPTVIIRAGTVRTPTIMLGGSADQSSGAGGSTTVPQENNPYLTARRVKKADGASAVELEEVIPEAQFAFAKPSIEGKSFARRFTAPARTAKVVVKAAPKVQVSEGDLNAILARRAKEVFGALT
jgi:hypothetical protein